MTIGKKLVLWLIAVTALPLAIVPLVIYISLANHFEWSVEQELQNNVAVAEKSIDLFVHDRVSQLIILSNSRIFDVSQSAINSEHLSNAVTSDPYYVLLTYVETKNTVVASSDQSLLNRNYRAVHPGAADELAGTSRGTENDVYLSDLADVRESETATDSSQLDIELLSNIRDTNRRVIDALIGLINVNITRKLVYEMDERTIGGEYAYLVDDPGNVIFNADPDAKLRAPRRDLAVANLQQRLQGDEAGYVVYDTVSGRKVTGYAVVAAFTSGAGR